jgi:urea transport system ATP-binding protein
MSPQQVHHEIPMTDHLFHEGVVDTRHGPILYLDDVSVSFDGFKALNRRATLHDWSKWRG